MIENKLIDCLVALPSQLFYNTMIPVCIWFLARNKTNGKFRNRENEILFIDARNLGTMINRRNKELTDEDILKISSTYHNWRNIRKGDGLSSPYEDIAGFCKSSTHEEVKANSYVLTPGRYVGTEEIEDDGIPFANKMNVLTTKLAEQFAKSDELEKLIKVNLKTIGFNL